MPGTVREEVPPRKAIRPQVTIPKNNVPSSPPKVKPLNNYDTTSTSTSTRRTTPTTTTTTTTTTTPRNTQNIILSAHPQDNEIAGSVNIKSDQSPNVNVPFSVENDSKESHSAKLNLGAIVALGAFGGFVFLAAVITTIVILVRRCVI